MTCNKAATKQALPVSKCDAFLTKILLFLRATSNVGGHDVK